MLTIAGGVFLGLLMLIMFFVLLPLILRFLKFLPRLIIYSTIAAIIILMSIDNSSHPSGAREPYVEQQVIISPSAEAINRFGQEYPLLAPILVTVGFIGLAGIMVVGLVWGERLWLRLRRAK